MDHLTKEQRRKNMIANKSRGTKPELLFAKLLWNSGVRYRKNDRKVYGTPDFTMPGVRVAVFCDGEFWHGRNWDENKEKIKTNRSFWYSKIERNISHDAEVTDRLTSEGWKVFRFWETDIKREPARCLNEVLSYIHGVRNSIIPPSEIYGGACKHINIYGPHSYNRDGSIMSVSDQMAVVTHYLHNYGRSMAAPYKDIAEGLLEDIRQDNDNVYAVGEEQLCNTLLTDKFTAPFPPPYHTRFTFVDLFAGIGGIRLALQQLGGRCVFASEWNAEAVSQYFGNFGQAPFGDITKEETKTYIPCGFDLLCASLPMQAFAFKHRRSPFEKIAGTLFSEVAEVLRRRRPAAFLIECPALQYSYSHGSDLDIMLEILRGELGYSVAEPQILDSTDFNLAQHKDYLFIVGFISADHAHNFKYPVTTDSSRVIADILEQNPVSAKYYITEKQASRPETYPSLNPVDGKLISSRNPMIIDPRTIDMMPYTTKLDKINRKGIRHITPREYARLRGFPDKYKIKVSDAAAYRLFSSSSAVTLVREVAGNMIESMGLDVKYKYR